MEGARGIGRKDPISSGKLSILRRVEPHHDSFTPPHGEHTSVEEVTGDSVHCGVPLGSSDDTQKRGSNKGRHDPGDYDCCEDLDEGKPAFLLEGVHGRRSG